MTTTTTPRKRVNFMISLTLLEELEQVMPAGDRSNFVNEALEEKLIDFSRKKAFEQMEKSLKKQKKVHQNKDILKMIHEGRRY